MEKCEKCGKLLDYPKEGFATALNNEIVLMCLDCYEKNCAVINSKYEKDENYKKESDLPQDVIERLKKINYPIDKFLKEVVYDTDPSMREHLKCMEANRGHYPKEFQDLASKIKRSKEHPRLNEFQMERIKKYLEAGLSERAIVKACKADNFEVSRETIRRINKERLNPKKNCVMQTE
jgi:hypothetical protein